MPDDPLIHSIERMDGLLQALEAHPDEELRSQVQEIVCCLLEFHGQGLARLLTMIRQRPDDAGALAEYLARDELVGSLLVLHGLHPADLESRVAQALDRVRPFLASHGGDVELVDLVDGVVRLRLAGNCHGCPSSAATLKTRVEQAILELAPDAAGIEIEGEVTAREAHGQFVAVDRLSIS